MPCLQLKKTCFTDNICFHKGSQRTGVTIPWKIVLVKFIYMC